MTDTSRTDEVAAYEAAVRRHLADLPASVREDLLADLETHLAEVAADLEPGSTLAERLGPPEAYAAELREAAELDAAGGGSPAKERLTAALGRAAGVADRVTGSAGVGTFTEFRTSLKPAWWLLRGVAAACLLVYLALRFDEGMTANAVGSPALTLLLTGVLAAVFAWISLRIGAASANWRRGPQLALALGGVLVVWFAAARFLDVFLFETSLVYVDGSSDYSPYGHVEDVYPYTEDGELLTDVYLLDQYGSPLYLGDPSRCSVVSENLFDREGQDDAYGADADYGYQYPLCVPGDEDASPTPEPSESGTALPEDPTASEERPAGAETATPDETPSVEEPTADPAAD